MSSPGENADVTSKGSYYSATAKYGPSMLKLLELILAIICIALVDDPANNTNLRLFVKIRTASLVYATFGAFIIICAAYLIGRLIRDDFPWRITALLNFVGAVLFITCGAVLFRDWSDAKIRGYWPPNTTRLDLVAATGVVAFINGFIFLVDLVLVGRLGYKGELD